MATWIDNDQRYRSVSTTHDCLPPKNPTTTPITPLATITTANCMCASSNDNWQPQKRKITTTISRLVDSCLPAVKHTHKFVYWYVRVCKRIFAHYMFAYTAICVCWQRNNGWARKGEKRRFKVCAYPWLDLTARWDEASWTCWCCLWCCSCCCLWCC